ncbi:GNAT family N-acetyltransferase [Micrococcoides hystricis]|uniref:GNAT family N-acetyltransferase n=1 Tax=Micrococcoides hystricis TaxID=1572761 RepID=A0ABV6P8G5_9MICC
MSDADLLLRPWQVHDLPQLHEIYQNQPDLARQFPPIASITDLQDWLVKYARCDASNAVMALEVDGELAGCVAVMGKCENLNGWVFYWAAEHARGKGFTTAAVTALCNWALTDGGWYRLELGYRTNNPASGQVAERAGFIVEGTEREKFLIDGERIDVTIAARLASDPTPQPRTPVRLQGTEISGESE